MGDGHTIEYTGVVLYSCTPEFYIMLLINVASTHLIFKHNKISLKLKQ